MKRLLLYLRTLFYLKPKQTLYFFLRRILPAPRINFSSIDARPRTGIVIHPCLAYKHEVKDQFEFRFLNRSKRFTGGDIDWVTQEMPKLWRYNLHYFDYLQDPGRSSAARARLIDDWIAKNPPGTEDAWEPYTVSLRIVNWIKYFLQSPPHPNPLPEGEGTRVGTSAPEKRTHGNIPLDRRWLVSLHQQALWLERNIEYHLLANHYLKNGVALFFAGMYFEGAEADRWLEKGLRILTEEAEEQFLPDGGHYERSPMYHSICLEDYLDVLNVALSNPGLASKEVVERFKQTATAALDLLNDICLPDGEIPLFNDSAFGIAPPPAKLFEYAQGIIGYRKPDDAGGVRAVAKSDSGYYVVRAGGDMLVVDCGAIGPDYQPGHAHCDTLSYELALDGRRVIVDSGVHDYESGPRRQYSRSTRGHNTVVIDGQEQSEIWGLFRVARRAKPLGAAIARLPGNGVRFEGMHDGYRRLPGRVVHKRVIEYDGSGTWTVLDEVSGTGRHSAESYIHLHPDYSAKRGKDCIEILKKDGKAIGRLEVIGNASISFEAGHYFPEFGMELENLVIMLSCSGTLPLEFGYRISKGH